MNILLGVKMALGECIGVSSSNPYSSYREIYSLNIFLLSIAVLFSVLLLLFFVIFLNCSDSFKRGEAAFATQSHGSMGSNASNFYAHAYL